MDCAVSLASISPVDPLFQYSAVGPTEAIGDWTYLFENLDYVNCGVVSSCSLKTDDCSGPYTPGEITMAASSPWAITATSTDRNGWTETICVECTNGPSTITHPSFIVQ